MPDAVIVSTARTPIGRANKGSLVDCRPDDLTAGIVKAALEKVPELDPQTVEDLILGCGQPAGEAGYNAARVAAILAGMPDVPGVTVNRYCSSSLQAIRMAAHAIRAGEGDVFICAGVETVSRFQFGAPTPARTTPSSPTPRSGRASGPTARRRGSRRPGCPTSTSRWGRRRRTCAWPRTSAAARWTSSPRGHSSARSSRRRTASSSARSRRSRCPTAPSCRRTTARATARRSRSSPSSSRCSGPTVRSPPATPARSTTAPPRSS